MENSTGARTEKPWPGTTAGQAPAGRFTPPTILNDAMGAMLAENWWAIALRGVLGILFGILAFAMPAAVMLSLALLFGTCCLVDGLLTIVAAVRAAKARERWGLLVLEGALNLAMAAIAFLLPESAVLAFVFVTAFWAIFTGGLMLRTAFRLAVPYRTVVAGARWHRVDRLWCAACHSPRGWCRRTHLVAWRLCHRLRHGDACPRLPSAQAVHFRPCNGGRGRNLIASA